jgi:hypothetical protein
MLNKMKSSKYKPYQMTRYPYIYVKFYYMTIHIHTCMYLYIFDLMINGACATGIHPHGKVISAVQNGT